MIIRNHTVNFTANLLNASGELERIPLSIVFLGEHFRVDVAGKTQLENCDLPQLVDFDVVRMGSGGEQLDSNTGSEVHVLGGFNQPVGLRVGCRMQYGRRSFRLELLWSNLPVGKVSLTIDDDGNFTEVFSGTDCLAFVSQARHLRSS